MFFRDIPGHDHIKAQLIASVHEDRIPHAQLILGSNGGGHLPLTLAYVAYILCTDRSETDSCGQCHACIKTHKLIHPDVHFAFPVIGKKDKLRKEVTSSDYLPEWRETLVANPYLTLPHWMATLHSENKQADINVKECVDIIQKLGLKSFESDYKVQIIWMPEFLGKEGNRLLKLIEEPTDDTFILLVAEDQQRILNTILSRTQVTYVHDLSDEEIAAYMQDHLGQAADAAIKKAKIANGNIAAAIELAQHDPMDYSAVLLDWLRLCFKGDPVELKAWIDGFAGWSKEEQKNYFQYGIRFFREYLFSLATGQMSERYTTAEQATVEKMQRIIDSSKAESISNMMSTALDHLARNINPRIMLMADSLTVGEVLKSQEKVVTLYSI